MHIKRYHKLRELPYLENPIVSILFIADALLHRYGNVASEKREAFSNEVVDSLENIFQIRNALPNAQKWPIFAYFYDSKSVTHR